MNRCYTKPWFRLRISC